jgi:hypothetical protein
MDMNRKRLAITAAVIGATYPAWSGRYYYSFIDVLIAALIGAAAAAALFYFVPGVLTAWWHWIHGQESKEVSAAKRALRWIIRVAGKGGIGPAVSRCRRPATR